MTDNSHIYRQIYQHHIKNRSFQKKEQYADNIDMVVSVSGAAGIGKTTFCREFLTYLNHNDVSAVHVPLDGFMLDRELRKKSNISGNDPKASDIPDLIDKMKSLIHEGHEIGLPIYNHMTGKHDGPVRIRPCSVILLDGIMSLHYEIRERFPNLKIFLFSDDLVIRGFRLKVDMEERGYSVFEALAHSDEEFDSYNRWIYHQITFADLLISVDKHRNLSINQYL